MREHVRLFIEQSNKDDDNTTLGAEVVRLARVAAALHMTQTAQQSNIDVKEPQS